RAGVPATRRIDYWFSDAIGGGTLSSVRVVGSLSYSDHLGVVAVYNVGGTIPNPPADNVLLDDRFTTFVSANWPSGTFTSAQDTSIALTADGAFRIGALKSSMARSHYDGVGSREFDLTNNAHGRVAQVQPPD